MIQILLSYDLNSHHKEVKDEMLRIGYSDTYKDIHGFVRVLPNTTLLLDKKSNVIPENAVRDLEKAIQKVNSSLLFKKVELLKAIAVDFNNGFGI